MSSLESQLQSGPQGSSASSRTEGSYDLSVRFSSGTKEWDVAAGDIILTEAGGVMIEPDGEKMTYNRVDVYNRKGYILANCIENAFLK